MGRKALMKDLQKLHDELQDTMNWCAENDPDNANESVGGSHAFNDARTILAKCQERMLDEDDMAFSNVTVSTVAWICDATLASSSTRSSCFAWQICEGLDSA